MDSGRGSFAIFSTLLKSLKVKVSGSCAAKSRAVALSASRAVSTVSPKVTLIGVSPSGGSRGRCWGRRCLGSSWRRRGWLARACGGHGRGEGQRERQLPGRSM
jgi:hypothetical protein